VSGISTGGVKYIHLLVVIILDMYSLSMDINISVVSLCLTGAVRVQRSSARLKTQILNGY